MAGKTYVVQQTFRGVKTLLVHNCGSGAEALRKVNDLNHPAHLEDVEGLDADVTMIYKARYAREDRPAPAAARRRR